MKGRVSGDALPSLNSLEMPGGRLAWACSLYKVEPGLNLQFNTQQCINIKTISQIFHSVENKLFSNQPKVVAKIKILGRIKKVNISAKES